MIRAQRFLLFAVLLTGTCLLFSCYRPAKNDLISGMEVPELSGKVNDNIGSGVWRPIPEPDRIDSLSIIAQIADYRSVDGAVVGYAGSESEQHKRYVIMKKICSTADLVKLTKHESANVKVYAFWALEERFDVNIKSLLLERIKDTQSVLIFPGGCVGEWVHVNAYLLRSKKDDFPGEEWKKCKRLVMNCYKGGQRVWIGRYLSEYD